MNKTAVALVLSGLLFPFYSIGAPIPVVATHELTAKESLKQQSLLLAKQAQQLAELQRQMDALKRVFAQQNAALSSQVLTSTKPSTMPSTKPLATNVTKQTFIAKSTPENKPWQLSSYGSMLYKSEEIFRNIQDTDPERRAKTDLERVVIELEYQFNPQWDIEVELEYEHGGTGAALEYDGFEEFGEFESEIEAGGEVIVEQLALTYHYSKDTSIEFGNIYVPVGIGTELHKPSQYFTTERHWSEATLIPQTWHENGIKVTTQWQDFSAQVMLSSGLNSEYFRTYSWVAGGHQKRFEQVNSDDLALTLRFDYGDVKHGSGVGFSFYSADTGGNRNNEGKLAADAHVNIYGLHGAFRGGNWVMRGQYLFGELEDSQAITAANKTTPGLQPGNFSQIGSESAALFGEIAYNTQSLFELDHPLYFFAAFESANPIKAVEQGIATDRFDISEFSLGANYLPIPQLVIKAQLSEQQYEQANIDDTHTFSMSFGYQFTL